MLQITDLTFNAWGRKFLVDASVSLPPGAKVGLVGRNGIGKSTLFKLILGELNANGDEISLPKTARIGSVDQEHPATPVSVIDTILEADVERHTLLGRLETAPPEEMGEIWSRLIARSRAKRDDAAFFAETLGCRLEQVSALRSAGFDYLFNSSRWWDFKSPWLLEQYNAFRAIAPSIAFPESHDTERLATELAPAGCHRDDAMMVERAYRMHYLFSAVFSTGVMIPVGFEYGFRGRLNVVHTRPQHWEQPLIDITAYIAAVNRMRANIPVLNEEGPQRQLQSGDPAVACLLRRSLEGPSWVLSVINTDLRNPHQACISGLDDDSLLAREVTPGREGQTLATGEIMLLAPAEARIFVNA